MKYVIVGNSVAAVGAVEGIRKVDKTGEITIIGEESYSFYSRPLISYLLQGKTDEKKIHIKNEDFYCTHACSVILSKKVSIINKAEKSVTLDDGQLIWYDKLLVATGSTPFVPNMSGLEKVETKTCFYTLDDAHKLQSFIDKNSKVLIVGAGLIGLKCAEGIYNSVAKITVVDLANRILPNILDEEASNIVLNHLEGKGIDFRLSDSVKEFEKNSATLGSGEKLDFDVLVLAIGVRPVVSLVAEAEGKVERGIIVDEHMKTTLEDIYSAGDCTVSHDVSCGKDRVLALFPSAYLQGECAGQNMAGGDVVFKNDFPMNATGLLGLHIATAGSYEGECFIDNSEGYKKLYYADNVLKGFIIVGNTDKAGIYTSLIRDQKPLNQIDFELIQSKPSLLAFSRADRNIMLGGVK
ncbi:MAG: FAD-dependent oxidoreductase [Clostridia bacterium]|nr:FAD-dependent oxidoreductase [Clostridia bacterium]